MSLSGDVEKFMDMARNALVSDSDPSGAQVFALLAIAAALDELAGSTLGIAAEVANK